MATGDMASSWQLGTVYSGQGMGRYRVLFIGNCSLFVAGLRSDVTIVTRKYEEEWGGRLGGGGM